MNLTQTQISQASNWLNKKSPRNVCRFCNANKWQIGDIFAPTVVYQGNNIDVGGDCRAMLQVFCLRCGKVELFDAITLGLI